MWVIEKKAKNCFSTSETCLKYVLDPAKNWENGKFHLKGVLDPRYSVSREPDMLPKRAIYHSMRNRGADFYHPSDFKLLCGIWRKMRKTVFLPVKRCLKSILDPQKNAKNENRYLKGVSDPLKKNTKVVRKIYK